MDQICDAMLSLEVHRLRECNLFLFLLPFSVVFYLALLCFSSPKCSHDTVASSAFDNLMCGSSRAGATAKPWEELLEEL